VRNILLALGLAWAASAALAGEFTARVIVVIDGDTVLVVRQCQRREREQPEPPPIPPCTGGKPVKIRLAEIDAPEKAQPGGIESTQSLAGMVLKKRVRVNVLAVDKYGRLVAHIELNGNSINEEQVRRGMAWEYSSFHRDKIYIALQNEARRAQRGLWAQADSVPPWEWRKQHADDARAPSGEGQ
jgi:endonuclease YncB( thermonuclease family)